MFCVSVLSVHPGLSLLIGLCASLAICRILFFTKYKDVLGDVEWQAAVGMAFLLQLATLFSAEVSKVPGTTVRHHHSGFGTIPPE